MVGIGIVAGVLVDDAAAIGGVLVGVGVRVRSVEGEGDSDGVTFVMDVAGIDGCPIAADEAGAV